MSYVIVNRKMLTRAFVITAACLPSATSAQQPVAEKTPPGVVQELSTSFRAAIERARPSIVFIETLGGPRKLMEWSKHESPQADQDAIREPGNDFDDRLPDVRRDGSGTGIIFDARGYVLTCYHVVEAADVVFVRLADGRRIESVKVLTDPLTDLAVVQIADAGPLSAATLADSDALRVGDWVVSIGNPYRLGLSVSAGIVSGTNRHSQHVPRTPLIQTDAASNPGNSGGALINPDGHVVGISQGGYGEHDAFQGIGLAVPINVAKRVARQLIDHGRVPRVALGCYTEELTSEVAQHLGIVEKLGLIVSDVKPRSPAAEAGLLVGDVITHFDGTQVGNNIVFLELMEQAIPGRDITFSVIREHRKVQIIVQSKEIPAPRNSQRSSEVESVKKQTGYHDDRLGLTLDEISPDLATELGYKGPVDGMVITHVTAKSPAAKEGLCAGMLLLQVDNKPVTSEEEYQRVTKKQSSDREILMLIGTPRGKHFIVLRQ